MAKVVSINISTEKGVVKKPVDEAVLQKGHGIVGDAHAGDWHRQVSLLAEESIDKMRVSGVTLSPGVFAENITTRGLTLCTLPIGTQLKIGEAVLSVTQIGKECHMGCEIRRIVGDCVMPREGIFAVVVKEGTIRPEDEIQVIGGGADEENCHQ